MYFYPHSKTVGFHKDVPLKPHCPHIKTYASVDAFVCVWLTVGERNWAAPAGSRGGEKEARGAGKAT